MLINARWNLILSHFDFGLFELADLVWDQFVARDRSLQEKNLCFHPDKKLSKLLISASSAVYFLNLPSTAVILCHKAVAPN